MRVDYKVQGFFSALGDARCSSTAVWAYERMARFHLSTHMELMGDKIRDRNRADIEVGDGRGVQLCDVRCDMCCGVK